jgi:tRNA-modifying protein YgfZ
MKSLDFQGETGRLAAEQAMLSEGSGFVRLPEETCLELGGRDCQTFLHGMCTQNIRDLAAGQGTEAFITNGQGKVVGYVHVRCHAERLELVTAPGQAEFLTRHLDKYIIREDVQILDRTAQWHHWWIVGPAAHDPLRTLSEPADLKIPGQHVEGRWNDLPFSLQLLQTVPTIYRLMTSAEDEGTWRERLESLGLLSCSAAAAELWRLECGWPRYGLDVTADNLPQEVDRNQQAISFTKGCYLGQETVARLDALGHVNRRLMGLMLPGDTAWDSGTEILRDGKVAARITSSAYSPRHPGVIGMGYVRRGWDQPGEILATDGGQAIVTSFPIE